MSDLQKTFENLGFYNSPHVGINTNKSENECILKFNNDKIHVRVFSNKSDLLPLLSNIVQREFSGNEDVQDVLVTLVQESKNAGIQIEFDRPKVLLRESIMHGIRISNRPSESILALKEWYPLFIRERKLQYKAANNHLIPEMELSIERTSLLELIEIVRRKATTNLSNLAHLKRDNSRKWYVDKQEQEQTEEQGFLIFLESELANLGKTLPEVSRRIKGIKNWNLQTRYALLEQIGLDIHALMNHFGTRKNADLVIANLLLCNPDNAKKLRNGKLKMKPEQEEELTDFLEKIRLSK